MTSRPSSAAPILAALAIVLLPLGAYVGGYYGLGKFAPAMVPAGGPPETIRIYRAQWQYNVFGPLAWLESKVTRRDVTLIYGIDGDFLESFSISAGS